MDIPNRIAALIARSLTGESSQEDEQELAAYVESNPEVQQHVETLKKLWQNNAPVQKHTSGLQSSDRLRIRRILAKAEEEKKDLLIGDKPIEKERIEDKTIKEERVDDMAIKKECVEDIAIKKECVEDIAIKKDSVEDKTSKEEGIEAESINERGVELSKEGVEVKIIKEKRVEVEQRKEDGLKDRVFNERGIEDKPIKEEGADEKQIIERGMVRQIFARYIPYAAILFLVVAGSWFFHFRGQKAGPVGSTSNERVVFAQKGSRTRTLLPDGTIVWLNSGSKISYSGDFKGALREVHLSGEAFFDVVKQPNRPFIVHAGDINVRVLGTAFNVKFYEGDQNIETTLLRGSIEVTSQKDKNSKILLKPNEKLVVSSHASQEDSSLQKEAVLGEQKKDFQIIQFNTPAKEDKLLETAWIYNRLEFRDDDFQALASKLERWYNVNIVFGDEAVKAFKFNGSFEKETIEEAMTALQKVHSFTYKINANEIYIQSSE